jgi:hypothetical protein
MPGGPGRQPVASGAMRSPQLRGWLLAAGFVVVATAAQLLRQSGAHVWDTVWAEDGHLYTADALSRPALSTIGRGYNGYIQVLPRLLALGTRLVPAQRIATYLAATAALVTSLLGLVVIRSSGGWMRSWALRGCLGVMCVLAPVSYYEVDANLANLGWPLLVASFWVLASRREGRADVALRVLVVVLAALSTSVAIVLLPWAVVVVGLRRRRADLVVGGAFLVGLIVQAVADLSTTAAKVSPGWQASYVTKAFAARVLGSLAIGERWIPGLWLHHSHLLMFGSTLVVVGVAGLVIALNLHPVPAVDSLGAPAADATPPPTGSPRTGAAEATGAGAPGDGGRLGRAGRWFLGIELDRWWLAGGAAVVALAVYLSTTWIRGDLTIGLTKAGTFDEGGSRYLDVPVILLFTSLAVLVDGAARRWLRAAFVSWTVLVVAASLRLPTLRSGGPSWSVGVTAAHASCDSHPGQAMAVIPITPRPGWFATVPCDDLR